MWQWWRGLVIAMISMSCIPEAPAFSAWQIDLFAFADSLAVHRGLESVEFLQLRHLRPHTLYVLQIEGDVRASVQESAGFRVLWMEEGKGEELTARDGIVHWYGIRLVA